MGKIDVLDLDISIANNRYNGVTDEEIEDTFDSLKKVFRYLWI